MTDADLLEKLKAFRRKAVERERIEIARLLRIEADEHTSAARELREDYRNDDIADEAWAHDCEAATLNRWAELILARTPAVPEPIEPEPVF